MTQAAFGWAIVGPGSIAGRFAQAVRALPGAQVVQVCGRDLARAQAFANTHAPQALACTDLAEVLVNPHIHGLYVATPHAQHHDAVAACLHAGKPVLCEKPLVPNAALAADLIAISQSKRVFLMEALWSRFLPIYAQVGTWLQAGSIGQLRSVSSSFCFNAPYTVAPHQAATAHTRLYAPGLAGGSLLDIGVYCLSLSRWALQTALGEVPKLTQLHVKGVLAPTGVDTRVQAQLSFDDTAHGPIGVQMLCAFDASAENTLCIVGERGHITVGPGFWQATQASLNLAGQPPQPVQRRFEINGFEGQIRAAMACVAAGEIECPQIPHLETLETLTWMDRMRAKLGVRYPFE